jgi:hypothetical protein
MMCTIPYSRLGIGVFEENVADLVACPNPSVDDHDVLVAHDPHRFQSEAYGFLPRTA